MNKSKICEIDCSDRNDSGLKIAIRVDGSADIGIGHVMRCLTIADELWKNHVWVRFIISSEQIIDILQERGYEYYQIGTELEYNESETKKIFSVIEEHNINLLIVDSYYASANYLNILNERVKVAYIDDFGTEVYPVAININYNIFAPELGYERKYANLWKTTAKRKYKTLLLLGSKYALVRPEFRAVNYKIRALVESVLITMGGSDCYNIAHILAEKICADARFKDLSVEIVCGKLNRHADSLRVLEMAFDNIHIHYNVNDMASLMGKSDIAIAAAGTTMYELCTVGVPTITCSYVKNQNIPARAFAKIVGMPDAGDYPVSPERMIENVLGELNRLVSSLDKRRELSLRMRMQVDGRGAERLAKEIINYKELEL